MSPLREELLRDAVAAELARLTGAGGPAATRGPRATSNAFADDPRRALLRRQIIVDYLDDGWVSARRSDRGVVITAGVPGAGKSTAVKAILGAAVSEYRRLDADVVKDALLADALGSGFYEDLLATELADGKPVAPRELASLVHVESTQIWDSLRRHSIDRGEQIVIEGTLAWPGLGELLLGELAEGGYTHIRVVVVEVPEPIAQNRAIDRWWQVRHSDDDPLGGRFTPPDVISGYYRPVGGSVYRANAEMLAREAAQAGFAVDLDIVDENGAIRR